MIANLQNTIFNTVAGAMAGRGDRAREPVASSRAPAGSRPALLTSPLFHVSGCHSSLVVGMLGGLKLVIPEGGSSPRRRSSSSQDERVTIWATVPTMVWRVCEYPDRHDYDTSSVTSVAFGGSPSADELQRKVRETFPNVRTHGNAYGLTESSSVATVITGADALDKPDVGRAADAGRRDPHRRRRRPARCRPGETGEVLIKGPIIMPGYWGKPEATAETRASTAGCTPATSATSTRTATSTSPTGPRT